MVIDNTRERNEERISISTRGNYLSHMKKRERKNSNYVPYMRSCNHSGPTAGHADYVRLRFFHHKTWLPQFVQSIVTLSLSFIFVQIPPTNGADKLFVHVVYLFENENPFFIKMHIIVLKCLEVIQFLSLHKKVTKYMYDKIEFRHRILVHSIFSLKLAFATFWAIWQIGVRNGRSNWVSIIEQDSKVKYLTTLTNLNIDFHSWSEIEMDR